MLKEKRITALIFGIFMGVLLPTALVGIVFTAINQRFGAMAGCIALSAISFYSLPFIWLRFARLSSYKRVYDAIIVKGYTTLDDISRYTLLDKETCEDRIKRGIAYGYIPDKVYFNKVVSQDPNIRIGNNRLTCPSCGSKEFTTDKNTYICKYCGARIRIERK